MGEMVKANATYDEHFALVLVDLMESHDIPQVQEAKDLPKLVHAQNLQSNYSHFSQLLCGTNAVGLLRRTSPRRSGLHSSSWGISCLAGKWGLLSSSMQQLN